MCCILKKIYIALPLTKNTLEMRINGLYKVYLNSWTYMHLVKTVFS